MLIRPHAPPADAATVALRYADSMQRLLITAGLVFLALGVAWPWLTRLGLGRLPGDFHVQREGFSLHFPLTSSIVVSIILSLIVTLIVWFTRR